MKKVLMYSVTLLYSLFAVSCSGNLNTTGMHLISVYDTVSLQMTEYPLEEYITTHGLNMLVPLDATCSACLFETSWWDEMIQSHPNLKPVFVVKLSDFQYQ